MTAKLKQIIPFVPRDFVTTPFFAAVKQTEPRTLQTGDGITWIIGDDHPDEAPPLPCPRHAPWPGLFHPALFPRPDAEWQGHSFLNE